MENYSLLEELKTLAQNDDALAVSREVNELKVRFDDLMMELERKDQIAAMDAELRGETHEPIDIKPLKDGFYELYLLYRERRKEQTAAKKALEEGNLTRKRQLIERLKAVIQHEENIGHAFASQKEIHEKWKEIGDIPRQDRDAVQQEYSKLLEQFFYNINIYKELKDHDYKRNKQLKQEVIDQINDLSKIDTVKDVESRLRQLQNEWDEIGPVPNAEWEELKTTYWTGIKNTYSRINAYYDDRRVVMQERITRKRALITQAEELASSKDELKQVAQWEEATKKITELQSAWREIGPGPRKENDEVWHLFSEQCNVFFSAKKDFFGEIRSQQQGFAQQKQGLIAKAEALKDSNDWKATADQLIKLQKEWKQIGHAGQRQEQKLWSAFRGACDAFFNSRQKHFEAQDEELEANLTQKEAIISEIESYELSENRKESLEKLKSFSSSFNAIGKVPMKHKDRIYTAFKSALDKQYGQLKLEGEEREKILFEAKIETLTASPEAGKALAKERSDLRRQIDLLRKDIMRYENNLGFFGRSKGAEQMKKEVETKIEQTKRRMDGLQRKLKLIPNE
jgi:HPt (histidine-containing phosphotransfer) domain-containing protein